MKALRLLPRACMVFASLGALAFAGSGAWAQEPAAAPQPQAPAASDSKETKCNDKIDNDGDSVVDCADADCFNDPVCKPSGLPERTNSLCSDFLDNDGDGAIDCDDHDCQSVAVCQGSWKGAASGASTIPTDLPEEGQGVAVEELIGKGSDKDGERTDELCSDGVDNDNDGRTDCADFGCRFDPQVTVCTGNPGIRFSVVGQISQSHFLEHQDSTPEDDTRITALQLRALGPIKGIQDSFFLLSMRAERTPRLTFAMFQVPLGHKGHFLNINTGGGGLSAGLIASIAKAPLVDPAYYMFNAFEQGNGAAAEIGGPIDSGSRVHFRAFAAGGSGRQSGNVGGRYFQDDNHNYTFAAGGQFTLNLVGYYNRFDTPMLYTSVPMTMAVVAGGKYDRRATERYPAGNGQFVLRYKRAILMGETYYKRELEFKSTQYAYNVMAGFLLWPRHVFLAADFGEFIAGNMDNPPAEISDAGSDVKKQRDERMFRAAAHWYFYSNIGVLSALYRNRELKSTRDLKDGYTEQEVRLVAQYRF